MSDVENFLEHYGVKGMKWGVQKEYQNAIKAQLHKISDADQKTSEIHKQVKNANLAKGMSRVQAGKAAFNDSKYKKADKQIESETHKLRTMQMNRRYEVQREYDKINKRMGDAYFRESGKGHRWVSLALTAGMSLGYNYQRSAGYGKGASLVTSLLSGPVGNMSAVNFAANNARSED